MTSGIAAWELGSFRSLFADPFLEGSQLENAGNPAEALLVGSLWRHVDTCALWTPLLF